MSDIFKSRYLNEYFKKGLEKEDFTLEDLSKIECMTIINEDPNQFIKIGSEDLKILCGLGCQIFLFEGIDLNDVKFEETTLTTLELARCKLATCDFSKLQIDKCLALYDGVELQNNGISQFAHMTRIEEFNCVDCNGLNLSNLADLKEIKYLKIQGNVTNLSSISNLQKLTSIEITRIKDVSSCLPITERLETLEINDAELVDINFLRKYPNLKKIALPESQIDISQIDILCELKRKGIHIQFDETKLKEQLEQKEYKFEEKDLKIVKRLFYIRDNVPVNDYELLNRQRYGHTKLEIEDIRIFDCLINSGLLNEESIIRKLGDIKGVDFDVENLEGLTLDILEYISQNKDKQFRFAIRTLNGLDSTVLKKLSENGENIQFYIQGDFSHFQNQTDVSNYKSKKIHDYDMDNLIPYRLEEMKEFISILEPIKEQTYEVNSDIEKFAMIRKIALMSSRYDYKGVMSSEQFEEKSMINTRSLKGIFLEGKAVCAGNALGFSIIAEYVGLGAKYISGCPVENGDNIRPCMESDKNSG